MALTFLFILPMSGNADVVLNPGESFVFSFTLDDFEYQYDLPQNDQTPAQFGYQIKTISPVAVIPVTHSLHEGSISSPPFEEETWGHNNFPADSGSTLEWVGFHMDIETGRTEYWPSASGSIKITAVDTPFAVSLIYAGTVIDNKYYTASIPEPNSIALLIVGSGLFYLRKKTFPIRKLGLQVQRQLKRSTPYSLSSLL